MRRLFISLWMLTLVLFVAPDVFAQQQAPNTIAYQGYLTDTDGVPLSGTALVLFNLYDQRAGGTALWQEVQRDVLFTDGVFTVHLGSVESLAGVPFEGPLWLGVSIGGGAELTPRVALESVPYAMTVRGLRVVPGEDPNAPLSPNVIVGFEGHNGVDEGVSGAVISGGGGPGFNANQVRASYGTIAGGIRNLVSDAGGTVGGGSTNEASGQGSTVGGGVSNRASGLGATIGGGDSIEASGQFATVGGGASNVAGGEKATVPGGQSNLALGDHSFAAGWNARALHNGSFVWADRTEEDFESTGENQFLLRAQGGVGIGTNTPQGALHAQAADNDVPDLVLGGTESDDSGLITSDLTLPSSDLNLRSNGSISFQLDSNDDESNPTFVVSDGEDDPIFLITESGLTAASELQVEGSATAATFEAEDDLGDTDTPEQGGVYRDNVVYAWAHVQSNGTVASSYGCTVAKLTGTGLYRITFKRQLPNGTSAIVTPQTLDDPIIATAVTNANQADVATKVFNGAAFVPFDAGFYIQVVGRP